jgi:uncharacterized protein YkwD
MRCIQGWMRRARLIARAGVCLLVAGVGVAALAMASASGDSPGRARILSVKLDPPAVVGRTSALTVRAVDPRAAVSGMVVNFGRGEGVFGTSACRASSSGVRTRPFAPGSKVSLSATHTFGRSGARQVLARLDSGGCGPVSSSIFQPVTVTPRRSGQRPVGLVPGTAVEIPAGSPAPALPGARQLPPPIVASGLHPAAIRLSRARGCVGARRRVGRGARAHAVARRAVVCLINAVRRRRHRRPLRVSASLVAAALAHSRSMVRRGYFSHVQPGGIDLRVRLQHAEYLPRRWWLAGENLGFGSGRRSSPLFQVRAWMRSTPHRANILERRFREVGVGLVNGSPGGSRGTTYTVDFGVRR